MNRKQKNILTEAFAEKFTKAKLAILVDYKGTTVEKINSLRRALEKSGEVEFHVMKNTLARRAVDGTTFECMVPNLVGPNAILFGYGDPVPATKILVDMAKVAKTLDIKSGVLRGKILTGEDIIAMSKLPGREQLLGQVLATMQAPVSGFVRLLAQVPGGLLNVLTAIKDQKDAA